MADEKKPGAYPMISMRPSAEELARVRALGEKLGTDRLGAVALRLVRRALPLLEAEENVPAGERVAFKLELPPEVGRRLAAHAVLANTSPEALAAGMIEAGLDRHAKPRRAPKKPASEAPPRNLAEQPASPRVVAIAAVFRALWPHAEDAAGMAGDALCEALDRELGLSGGDKVRRTELAEAARFVWGADAVQKHDAGFGRPVPAPRVKSPDEPAPWRTRGRS